MGSDGHMAGGWVDYLIARDDPEDRALLDEFRDRAWSYGQLMQFICASPANINADTAARMDEAQEERPMPMLTWHLGLLRSKGLDGGMAYAVWQG